MSATYEEIESAFDNGDLNTDYPPSVVEAYCDIYGIDLKELLSDSSEISSKIEDNYIGHFESYEAFITDYILEIYQIDPNDGAFSYLVIDYPASWNANYRHEFEFSGDDRSGEGHYFHQH